MNLNIIVLLMYTLHILESLEVEKMKQLVLFPSLFQPLDYFFLKWLVYVSLASLPA